jgi:HEAT repeat protein
VVEAVGARVEVERLLPLLKDEDGDVRAAVVKAVGAKVEVETLLSLLEDEYADVRRAAVEEIEHHSAMLSDEALLALIGDEAGSVRKAALNVVRRHRPELLSEIYAEAHAILQHQPPGKIFRSLSSIVVAQMIGGLRLSGPASFAKLEEYLHWHHWQTRLAAVRALAKIRRHIPDHLVQLLLVLRRNDPSMPVRHAADDALADILTIEPMEDEWDEDSAPSDI